MNNQEMLEEIGRGLALLTFQTAAENLAGLYSKESFGRNRFTFSTQYDLPFGQGKRFLNRGGITNQIAGGWKTSLIFQTQTGDPVFLTFSNQGSSYPVRVGDSFAAGVTPNPATQPNFVCATKAKSLAFWCNPCAFANPSQAYAGPDDPSANLINIKSAPCGLQHRG